LIESLQHICRVVCLVKFFIHPQKGWTFPKKLKYPQEKTFHFQKTPRPLFFSFTCIVWYPTNIQWVSLEKKCEIWKGGNKYFQVLHICIIFKQLKELGFEDKFNNSKVWALRKLIMYLYKKGMKWWMPQDAKQQTNT
jgi:hypothetical protein